MGPGWRARRWLKSRPPLDREGLRRLAAALWERPVHELRSFAIELLTARRSWYGSIRHGRRGGQAGDEGDAPL